MLLETVHEGFEVPCPFCGHRFLVAVGTVASAPPAAVVRDVPSPRRHGGGPDEGTIPLILGIVGMFMCITAPIAWVVGARARSAAIREGRDPGGSLTAGWILGIIGTILWLLVAGFYGILMIVIAGNW